MRTEGDADVAEGAAGDGEVDGELSVAESREEGAEAGNGVGQGNGGAGVEPAGAAGGHENAGTDHPAKPKSDQVEPPQAPLHVPPRPLPCPAHLLERRRR